MNSLTPNQWTTAKKAIDKVFKEPENLGLIAIADTGTTQEDGFDDCSQQYHKTKQKSKNEITGFCFYSNQDSQRAKTTGILPLSFWGAPDGNDQAMITIGKLIQENFEKSGFKINWNRDPGVRPELKLD